MHLIIFGVDKKVFFIFIAAVNEFLPVKGEIRLDTSLLLSVKQGRTYYGSRPRVDVEENSPFGRGLKWT